MLSLEAFSLEDSLAVSVLILSVCSQLMTQLRVLFPTTPEKQGGVRMEALQSSQA
jgi:hypothetical protein